MQAIIMSPATLVGIDLGKHRFHLQGQDEAGHEVFRKTTRRQRMRVRAEMKLIWPQFVQPFVSAIGAI